MNVSKLTASDLLWDRTLADGQFYAYQFERNVTIDTIVADFYCADTKLIVLIDKAEIEGYSRAKQAVLTAGGYYFATVKSADLITDLQAVLPYITEVFKQSVGGPCGGW